MLLRHAIIPEIIPFQFLLRRNAGFISKISALLSALNRLKVGGIEFTPPSFRRSLHAPIWAMFGFSLNLHLPLFNQIAETT